MTSTISPASHTLFVRLANDASNWSGTPLITITAAERGNLTQLKRADLLSTFDDGGCSFAQFTEAGKAYAAEHGTDLSWIGV